MKHELEVELKRKYPKCMRFLHESSRNPLSFAIETGDGWFGLIDRMCEKIEPQIDLTDEEEPIYFVQIKEKFGELRAYLSWQTKYMDEFIRQAEAESSRTCEVCGKPGRNVGKSWIFIRCEECGKNINNKDED
jgi:hypothetical protein